MTRTQTHLARALRPGARKRRAEAVGRGEARDLSGQADKTAQALAGPTAVQLAIEFAQSLSSVPRLETRASSAGVESRVPVPDK